MQIEPVDGEGDCGKVGCEVNLNENCPEELRVIIAGETIGCLSACSFFNTDAYCCRTECVPNEFSSYFKNQCPDAYVYGYDDIPTTVSCTNASNYRIVFGI